VLLEPSLTPASSAISSTFGWCQCNADALCVYGWQLCGSSGGGWSWGWIIWVNERGTSTRNGLTAVLVPSQSEQLLRCLVMSRSLSPSSS